LFVARRDATSGANWFGQRPGSPSRGAAQTARRSVPARALVFLFSEPAASCWCCTSTLQAGPALLPLVTGKHEGYPLEFPKEGSKKKTLEGIQGHGHCSPEARRADFGVRRVGRGFPAGRRPRPRFAALTQLPAVGYSPLLSSLSLSDIGGRGNGNKQFGSHRLARPRNWRENGDQGLAAAPSSTPTARVGAAVGAALLARGGRARISGVSGDAPRCSRATVAGPSGHGPSSWHVAAQAARLRHPRRGNPKGGPGRLG